VTRLLLDVGNSRVKWVVASGPRLGRQRALAIGARGALPAAALLAALPGPVDSVRMVSVADAGATRRLASALRRATGAPVQILRTTRSAAGVRCGYREPWRLGADRWAAVIGAHHLFSPARAACVVDVGTALTVDFVARDGRHRGGAIVPGPGLMIASLLRETQGIRRRATTSRASGRSLYSRSTREAIEQGARYAAAAFVERALLEARRQFGGRPELVVTGGGAADILPLLRSPCRRVPDLVLRGLAALG